MTEGLQWGAEDFPPGDQELWNEQYMRGRKDPGVAESGSEPVRKIEIHGAMPAPEASHRMRQLDSGPELDLGRVTTKDIWDAEGKE